MTGVAALVREVARLRALLRYAYEHVEPHELHTEMGAVDCASCRTIEAELANKPERTFAELLALRDALTREYEITAAREESVSNRPGWTRPDSPLERALHLAEHLEEHAPAEQRAWAERELQALRRLIHEATR